MDECSAKRHNTDGRLQSGYALTPAPTGRSYNSSSCVLSRVAAATFGVFGSPSPHGCIPPSTFVP